MVQVFDEWLKTEIFKTMGHFVLPTLDKTLKWPLQCKPKWGADKISDLESFDKMRAKYSKNFQDVPDIDVNNNIFKVGGTPIPFIVPIFAPSDEYPSDALPRPVDMPTIQIKQIAIPSLGVKSDGTVTVENTSTKAYFLNTADPNKWGVLLSSSEKNVCTRHQ